jgi:hypothetical protein
MKLGKAILCVLIVSLLVSMTIPVVSGGKKTSPPALPIIDGLQMQRQTLLQKMTNMYLVKF